MAYTNSNGSDQPVFLLSLNTASAVHTHTMFLQIFTGIKAPPYNIQYRIGLLVFWKKKPILDQN